MSYKVGGRLGPSKREFRFWSLPSQMCPVLPVSESPLLFWEDWQMLRGAKLLSGESWRELFFHDSHSPTDLQEVSFWTVRLPVCGCTTAWRFMMLVCTKFGFFTFLICKIILFIWEGKHTEKRRALTWWLHYAHYGLRLGEAKAGAGIQPRSPTWVASIQLSESLSAAS